LERVSEDTVHLCLWVSFDRDKSVFFERLRRCQLESLRKTRRTREDEGEVQDVDFTSGVPDGDYGDVASYGAMPDLFIEGSGQGYFEFGGYLWKTWPHGKGGRDKPYYEYVISMGGVTFFLRRESTETIPNMWVELGSVPLCQFGGLCGMWEELKRIFSEEGIRINRDLVSRVDMYMDTSAAEAGEFARRFEENYKVSRARKIALYSEDLNDLNFVKYMSGLRYTGFSLGRNIHLRCYDKRLEMMRDPLKWTVFSEKYEGIPDVLTRIEYQ
jgi:hypothetical protein